MKRSSLDDVGGPSKKRIVSYSTYEKWQVDMDKDFQTITWLDCEVKKEGVKKMVAKLSARCVINLSRRSLVGGTIVINGLLELTQSAQAISKTTLILISTIMQ